jgi:hypothetical protein
MNRSSTATAHFLFKECFYYRATLVKKVAKSAEVFWFSFIESKPPIAESGGVFFNVCSCIKKILLALAHALSFGGVFTKLQVLLVYYLTPSLAEFWSSTS